MSLLKPSCKRVLSKRQLWSFLPDISSSEQRSSTSKEQNYTLVKTINNVRPHQAYSVISDISQYQNYIPYCKESFVNKRDSQTGKPTVAGLRIGFKQYDETFICDVNCNEISENKHYMVDTNSVSHHLFHKLYCQWNIMTHPRRPDSTQIKLMLSFQFKSNFYNNISSLFANSVTQLAMVAFNKRIIKLIKNNEIK